MSIRILFAAVLFTFTSSSAFAQAAALSDTTASPVGGGLRFGVGAYLSTAQTLVADDAKITVGSSSAGLEIEYGSESAIGILVELMDTSPMAWGYSAGLAYEAEREIDEVEVSAAGGSASGSCTSDCPKFSIGHVYGNAIYRWNQFYLPFGLNISFVQYDASEGETTTIKSGLGIQAGGGYLINDNFVIEGLVKVLQADMKTTVGNTTIDFETVSFTGLNLAAKYFF